MNNGQRILIFAVIGGLMLVFTMIYSEKWIPIAISSKITKYHLKQATQTRLVTTGNHMNVSDAYENYLKSSTLEDVRAEVQMYKTNRTQTRIVTTGNHMNVSDAYENYLKSSTLEDVRAEVQMYKTNWKGDCAFPRYLPQNVHDQFWFPLYLSHLQKVKLSSTSEKLWTASCFRWWCPKPQKRGLDRLIGWKSKPILGPGNVHPKCTFGQGIVPRTRCSSKHEILWKQLNESGILFYPRGGTELGVLRGSSYLSSDGDIDVFVDMPQKMLVQLLQKTLSIRPEIKGDETHWIVKGCPPVHMLFDDWMTNEMIEYNVHPTHDDLCECMMNSVKMTCHKQALNRMYLMYGPSWRVPLHGKQLDHEHIAYKYNTYGILNKMASNDGIIYEKNVQALDFNLKYDKHEMNMILAQLNVLKYLMHYQVKNKVFKPNMI